MPFDSLRNVLFLHSTRKNVPWVKQHVTEIPKTLNESLILRTVESERVGELEALLSALVEDGLGLVRVRGGPVAVQDLQRLVRVEPQDDGAQERAWKNRQNKC